MVDSAAAPAPKGLNVALWLAQVLIGLVFLAAGAMKGFASAETVLQNVPWSKDVSMGLVRFIGISELLGGLGLLLPSITRIQPKLTVLAALGLDGVMILAAGFHLMRSELPFVVPNLVLGSLCGFIAWGRYKKAPIAPR